MALCKHLDSKTAQGPDVVLKCFTLFGAEKLRGVPVESMIVNEVFLLAVDGCCFHHIDEKVALLIVENCSGVELVMAFFVIV